MVFSGFQFIYTVKLSKYRLLFHTCFIYRYTGTIKFERVCYSIKFNTENREHIFIRVSFDKLSRIKRFLLKCIISMCLEYSYIERTKCWSRLLAIWEITTADHLTPSLNNFTAQWSGRYLSPSVGSGPRASWWILETVFWIGSWTIWRSSRSFSAPTTATSTWTDCLVSEWRKVRGEFLRKSWTGADQATGTCL